MLQKLQGQVRKYKAITKRCVQIELSGENKLIELTTSEPWVIARHDEIVVVGEVDPKSGKFTAYAYKNISKVVFGKYNANAGTGVVFVIAALLFFWAIFPLFTHLPVGLKAISLGSKVDQAFSML